MRWRPAAIPFTVSWTSRRRWAASGSSAGVDPQPAEQRHLELRERVDVRIAEAEPPTQLRVVVEQPIAARHPADPGDRPHVLLLDRVPEPGRRMARPGPRTGGRRRGRRGRATAPRCRGGWRGTASGRRDGRSPRSPARRARRACASSADPTPNQPGRSIRDCDQAKTHGIARRSAIEAAVSAGARPAWPPVRPRAAGRDPSRSVAISSIGVARRKKSDEPRGLDERQVGGAGRRRELVEDRLAGRLRGDLGRGVERRGRDERRRGEPLEVAQGDPRVGVVRGDDLALLGELQAALDRAGAPARGSPGSPGRRRGRSRRRGRGRSSARRRAGGPWPRGRPGRDGAASSPRGTRTPCSSRSSRASPPGGRPGRPGAAGRSRSVRIASRIRPAASRVAASSNSGTTSRTGASAGRTGHGGHCREPEDAEDVAGLGR